VHSILQYSRVGNNIVDFVIYIINHYTIQLTKKMEGNGPVTVETACSSSKGRMMEEAG